MNTYQIELTEEQLEGLRLGDYVEVEAVIEVILKQAEEQKRV